MARMESKKKSKKQITVILGCVIRNNKILLNLRSEKKLKDAHLRWELPGGKIEFNESVDEALVREIKEETGIEVKVIKLLPISQTVYWEYSWGTQQTLLFCYLCKFINKKEFKKDHHVEKSEWVPIAKIEKLDLLPGAKEFINETLKLMDIV